MASFNLDGTINKLSLVNWNNQFISEDEFKTDTLAKLQATICLYQDLH